jgi:hypothetical protein
MICPIRNDVCLRTKCGWYVIHHDEEGYEGCAMYVLGFQMNTLIDLVDERFPKK